MKGENGLIEPMKERHVPNKLYQLNGKEEQMEVDPLKPREDNQTSEFQAAHRSVQKRPAPEPK